MEEHERYELLLSRRLDGDLSPEEVVELQRHLSGCTRCREMAEDLLELREAIRGTEPEEVPEELLSGVMDEIWEEEARAYRKSRRRIWVRTLSALAACALVAVGLGRLGLEHLGRGGGASSGSTSSSSSMSQAAASQESTLAAGELDGGMAYTAGAGAESPESPEMEEYAYSTETTEDAPAQAETPLGSTQEDGAAESRKKVVQTPVEDLDADEAVPENASIAEEKAEAAPEAEEAEEDPEVQEAPALAFRSLTPQQLSLLREQLGSAPGRVLLFTSLPEAYAQSGWTDLGALRYLLLEGEPSQELRQSAQRELDLGEGPTVLVVPAALTPGSGEDKTAEQP